MKIKKNLLNIKNSVTGEWEQYAGIKGESAYEIAIKYGFQGTEEEFAKAQIFENKEILEQITQENIDLWNEGGNIDLTDYATKDYVDEAIDDVDVTEQLKDYAKTSHTHSQYASTSYVQSQLANLTSGSNIPSYVLTEAEMIANKVIEKRNAYSLVMSGMSDLHTTGSDTSATSVLHAFQGINEIDKLTPIDLVAIHGDVIVQKMDDTYKDGLRYVRTCMNEVTKNIPLIHMQGNHDELNTDTTEEARQKYFRYIGANNVDVTTDFGNRFRNYGYKDFDDLRIRFIYLNSADLSDFEQTSDMWITPMQYNWFINKALDFSNKEGAEDWQWIVACHHPLNWGTPVSNLQLILKAYTKKTTGSFTFTDPVEGSSTISYDFTNVKQRFICHVHGHIHNFRTEWFDDVLSVTVPNACFGRNNEYGTAYGDGSWAQITGGDADENGVQRQFNKTSNSANDTAFVTLVIDSRVNNKIYAYCYGAGIDREIDLTTKEVKYIDKVTTDDGGDTPEIPNEVLQYTNLVSTAKDSDGSVYNGVGYKDNIYLTSSTGLPTDVSGYVTTGFMELPNEFYVYSTNAEWKVGDSYCRLYSYKSDYSIHTGVVGSSMTDILEVTDMGNNITKFKILGVGNWNSRTYIRITFKGIGEGLYIYSQTSNIPSDDVIRKSIDKDGSIYNGKGYKENSYIYSDGSTAGEISTRDGVTATGFIPMTQGSSMTATGERIIELYNINVVPTEDNLRVSCYDKDFAHLGIRTGAYFATETTSIPKVITTTNDSGYIATLDISAFSYACKQITGKDVAYIRICSPGMSDSSYILIKSNSARLYEYPVQEVVSGKIDSSTGTESQSTGYFMTEFIEVTPNSALTLYSIGNGTDSGGSSSAIKIVEYDSNKSFISCASESSLYLGFSTEETKSATRMIGINTKYIKLRIYLGAFASSSANDVAYRQRLKENLLVTSYSPLGEGNGTLKGNLLPQAIDTDGTIYNGIGFKNNWRLSGDTGLAKENTGYSLTGFIPWTNGDVVRIKNIAGMTGDTAYIWTYDKDLNPLYLIDNNYVGITKNVLEYTWDSWTSSIYADAKYIRISFAGTLSTSTVITVNEEITDDMIPQAKGIYTNLIPRSVDTDGTVFDLDGYKTGYRINSSGAETQADGMCCTGFIPIESPTVGTVTVRVKNVNVHSSPNTPYFVTYQKDKTYQQVTELGVTPLKDNGTGTLVGNINHTGWIRICCAVIDHTSVLTINEEIPYANLVQTSINSDGTIYNVTGYKEGYRGNSSGTETALDGAIVSGFIPFTKGDVIRVYGNTTANNGAVGNYVNFYNSSFSHKLTVPATAVGEIGITYEVFNDKYIWTLDTSIINVSTYITPINDSSYIRCSLSHCTGDYFVVTINEPIQ